MGKGGDGYEWSPRSGTHRPAIIDAVIVMSGILGAVSIAGCETILPHNLRSVNIQWLTFTLPPQSYELYPFNYAAGDLLELTVNASGGKVNVIIINASNARLYRKGTEYDALVYYPGITTFAYNFTAPRDDYYCLVLENEGTQGVSTSLKYSSYSRYTSEEESVRGNFLWAHPKPRADTNRTVAMTVVGTS
jgi:hypothetical protein